MGGHDDGEQECHDQPVHKDNSYSSIGLKHHNIMLALFSVIDGPVTFFREKVVLPIQAKNQEKFYHRRFNRVPTVDQCDFEDPVCIYEADQQYYRDKMIDNNIVSILRQRKLECFVWEGPDAEVKCNKFVQDYENAATNWFIKYGDMKHRTGVLEAYMKQKHRLIWERRHPDRKLH